jgi:hypothetical protein
MAGSGHFFTNFDFLGLFSKTLTGSKKSFKMFTARSLPTLWFRVGERAQLSRSCRCSMRELMNSAAAAVACVVAAAAEASQQQCQAAQQKWQLPASRRLHDFVQQCIAAAQQQCMHGRTARLRRHASLISGRRIAGSMSPIDAMLCCRVQCAVRCRCTSCVCVQRAMFCVSPVKFASRLATPSLLQPYMHWAVS